jgi:2-oxoglutarate dehydrogenase complex dehydrogenase (E1) component-like enzyme
MGAWLWIAPHIKTALKDSRGSNFWPIYIGRSSAAAPATGSGIEHTIQREKFINEVFSPKNL